jgi:UDP-N-acetyl-2-amino-2-deoxyglucuronate dehydrogenase
MSQAKLQMALIGAGNIAQKYGQAVKNVETAELVGVVSSTASKAETFAEAQGIPFASDVPGRLFEKTRVDAVIVATPSGLHAEGAITAAGHGKHVLCEKPLDITLEKIDAMTEACAKAGVKLGCTYQHRTAEHNRIACEAVQSGRLGKIHIANAFLKNFRGQDYYDSAEWRGTQKLDGGGPFIQQAAHTIDLMVWMMGSAKRVWAQCRTVAHDIEVEDMGHAIVQYQNGAQGVLEASTIVQPGYPNRIEIHGEKGSIILTESEIVAWDVEGMDQPKMRQAAGSSGAKDPMAIGTEGHELIIRDFVEAVRQDRDPMVSPASARLSVELIQAIYESSETNQPVDLS